MNTQPPRQPAHLSDEERELARVVRALPGGEPPAALDALILKAASDAVASSEAPKKSRWNKAWLGTSALWLGTAAASVLTVGIGWEVFQSMRAPIYELPADENTSVAQEIDNSHKNDSIAIEVIPAREPAATAPPPPADVAAKQENTAVTAMASLEKEKAAKSSIRAAESDSRRQMADASAKKINADKESRRQDQALYAEQAPEPKMLGKMADASVPAQPSPAPMVAAAPAAAASDDAGTRELEAVSVTGSRILQTNQDTAAPVSNIELARYRVEQRNRIAADAKLSSGLWLIAIKNRVKAHDIEGAKASLMLYQETYPKLDIPEELKPLLK